MSPNDPQRGTPARAQYPAAIDSSSHGAGRRGLLAFLLVSLCATLFAAPYAFAQTPQPQATPHVRPRTVEPAQPRTQTPQPETTGAQTPAPAATPEEVDEDEVVRVDSNLVIIPASVVDFRGRAVTDLKVEDFELRVDGELKSIGDLSRSETPVHVALLFDNSASLSAAREFEKQAAVRFLRSVVRPIDRAAIYAVSTVPTLSQPLTNDVQRLVRTIDNFGKPEGATALFDALTQAADYMRAVSGRKVLVLVSDGTDTVSDASFEDAIGRALLAECQVYVVQTRQVEEQNLRDTVSEQRMLKLAEQTGGAVYVPKSVDELDAVFTQISLDLSQQYLLSYYPQEERKDKYFRFISLRVKTRPNLRVRARKGFYPMTTAQNEVPAYDPSRAEYVADASRTTTTATPSSLSTEAARRRASGASAPPANSARDAAANRKVGPDGPDEMERPRPSAQSNDTSPTFTLTAVASPAAPKPSTAATPQPVVSTPAPTPLPAPAVEPTPAPSRAQPSKDDAASVATSPETPATGAGRAAATASQPVKEEARAKPPVSGGVLNSKALSLPRPVYPQAAKSTGASGKVVVEVMIDEQGRVTEARAVSGPSILHHAAVTAARQARFSPATLSGAPVKIKGTISYTFVWP